MKFMEVSAKTGHNVELVRLIYSVIVRCMNHPPNNDAQLSSDSVSTT